MADAAKSDEIEDVLSSIRRLVSEHQPPTRPDPPVAQAPAPVSPPETATETTSQRLLLTPALRVTDPEDPWVPITPRTEEEAAAPVDRPSEAEIARDDGNDWARELWAEGDDSEEPVTDHAPDPQLQADQWEAGDLAADDAARAVLDGGLTDPVDVTEALLQDVAEAVSEDNLEDEDEGYSDAPLSFIRSTKSVSDYEPEEDNDALSGGDLPAPMLELAEARAAHAEPVATTAPPRVKVEIVRSAAAQEDPAPDAASLEGTLDLEPETDHESAKEPAQAAPADPAPLTDSVTDFLADDLEDTALQDDLTDAVEDLGEAPFSFPDDGDGFVDEDALREIIAEVVREELQGEMGVRITRNVRKLVRREIRLALATQDIE